MDFSENNDKSVSKAYWSFKPIQFYLIYILPNYLQLIYGLKNNFMKLFVVTLYINKPKCFVTFQGSISLKNWHLKWNFFAFIMLIFKHNDWTFIDIKCQICVYVIETHKTKIWHLSRKKIGIFNCQKWFS